MNKMVQKNNLVIAKKLGGKIIPITDTLIFAKEFGIRHDNVLSKCKDILLQNKKIRNLKIKVSKNTLELEKHIIETSYRVKEQKRKYKKFLLTQRGFTTLLLEISTPKNEEAKQKLFIKRQQFIDAFEFMQQMLLNQSNEEWKTLREQGKLIRKDETDSIKEFVEYAKSQGSTKAEWYYKHFTNATYKALKLLQHEQKGVRELLDTFQLHQLAIAEHKVAYWISEEIQKGTYYKDIFKNVKEKLFELAEHISFTPRLKAKEELK